MLRYTLNRLLLMIPILFFVSVIIFLMVHLAPGDPAKIMVAGRRTTAETLANIRARYHLDEPLPVQYVLWLNDVLHGDLGESFRLKQDVLPLILNRLPLTLKLVLGSTAITVLIGLPLGILSAVYKNSWIDYLASFLAMLGVSAPVFFSGVLAILIFAYKLHWLPAFGAGKGLAEEIRHLILPCLVLGLSMVALTSRMSRSSMLEVMASDYIEAARAKGLPGHTVVVKHALRNALIPVVTVTGLQVGFLLVGAMLVEHTFGLGGLGSLLINGVQNRDYPLVQGVTLFMVISFILINLIVDLLYGVIDPRIRLERGGQRG